MTQLWTPDCLERSPMFEPLRGYGAALQGAGWPTMADLQSLLDARQPPLLSGGGMPLRFVAPARRSVRLEDKYEARIYLNGEVQVRPANWHDFMNALVWLTFPLAKAALNARHYCALLDQQSAGTSNRGPLQDALTLFDEGGVIVAAGDAGLLRLLREFSWKELFWHNRACVESSMRFYLFGHALYEKALSPYTGLTGRGIFLEVNEDFFETGITAQTARLDALLEKRLFDTGAWRTTRELAPVPILGVPGWCADNECAAYYDNTGYFRPGRDGR
ncbi:MAG: DUF3025 domain-containing protein [Pseudomonadota bacterium]